MIVTSAEVQAARADEEPQKEPRVGLRGADGYRVKYAHRIRARARVVG